MRKRAKSVETVEKALRGFFRQRERAGIFSEFSEIQKKLPCRHAARTAKRHTCVTKGIFSDAHVAGKNIEFEFFDKLKRAGFHAGPFVITTL